MTLSRYAVVGAGPMGLAVALELLKAGQQVDVYERDDRIGGMSAAFDFDGLAIERYYHFICKTDESLFELLRELGLEQQLCWTDTKMGLFSAGKLYQWGTLRALLRFDRIGWLDKLRYASHLLWTRSISDWNSLDRRGAIEWLKRWLGERGYRVLWQRLFELKFYEKSDQLSAAWLGTRIKRIALSRRNLFTETTGYLEGGSEVLINAMRQRIEVLGGRIHLGAGIDQVVTEAGKVSGIRVHGALHAVDRVISTIPIQYVPKLAPGLPQSFVARIHAIENIPVVCVILKLSQPLSENFWMNICDDSIGIPGVIEYSNLNPGDGSSIVYAPFYMPKSHPKYARSDADFIEETLGYFHQLNPVFRRDWVLARHCHRYEFAQTLCPPGFYDMLPSMQTPLTGFYMADTAYYYPEDRSISESVRVGKTLAGLAMADGRVA